MPHGRKSRRFSRAEQSARKALAKFRPRKGEARSFVFIQGTTGKRIRPGTGKGLWAYVSKSRSGKLKAHPVRDYRRPLRTGSANSFNLERTHKKTALKNVKPNIIISAEGRVQLGRSDKEQHYGITWERISDATHKKLSFISNGPSKYILEFSITVRESDGKERTYNFTRDTGTSLSFNANKNLTREGLLNLLLSGHIYGQVARLLTYDRLVFRTSTYFIRNLSENKGFKKDEWTQDGFEWNKTTFNGVKLIRVDFKLHRIGKV